MTVPSTSCPTDYSVPPESQRRSSFDRIAMPIGFVSPVDRDTTLFTSFCQLRLLTLLAFGVACTLSWFTVTVVLEDAKLLDAAGKVGAAATLFVMRSVSIFGGASPTAPILFCAAIGYVWATGRMARLRLAHGISRLSPTHAVVDLVSTPIRSILHPNELPTHGTAHAVTTAERRVANAILRPITGPHYTSALAVLAFFPVLLFALKPLSTLERETGTWLLGAGLALSTLLICNTLIQLVQYWIGLEQLLKLILQHRLGRAFTRVAPFVRDSVADQVSRSPHDLLRLSSCVTLLDDLVRAGAAPGNNAVGWRALEKLRKRVNEAMRHREIALASAGEGTGTEASRAEARLGCTLVKASRDLVRMLTPIWNGSRRRQWTTKAKAREAPSGRRIAAPWPDRTAGPAVAECWRYTPTQLQWLRDAEAFAATVTALIVNRHVRQFQYFVYTLTASSLLLLLAVSSYVFEPHRLLLTCIWGIVGSVVVLGIWVYLEIDRNSLLSSIAGTAPGKLTWNGAFAVRVITWGIIPLLSVAAVQYPDFANQVFALLEPLTRSLR